MRSSLFANRFFNDCQDRKALLDELTAFHTTSDGLLDFEPAFMVADQLLDAFLSTPTERRKTLCQFDGNITRMNISKVFANLNKPHPRTTTVKKVKLSVCDYESADEVDQLVRAFGARCMVSGLQESRVLLSVDRIVQAGRYNWSDTLLMSSRINDGKWVREGGIFHTKETLLDYLNSQEDLHGLCVHRAAIKIMRKFYVGLITTHYNQNFTAE